MKIVHIIGGLGNQMFQYAFLVALRETFHEPVYADLSSFTGYGLHNGYELNEIFGIDVPIASKSDLKRLTRYASSYQWQRIKRHFLPRKHTEVIENSIGSFIPTVFTDASDKYYEGYWQTYTYFDHFKELLRSDFTFPPIDTDSLNSQLVADIKKDPERYVSLHVRRGDYVMHPRFGGICDVDYYTRGIQKAIELNAEHSQLSFLVFSNDFDWVKAELSACFDGHDYRFIDWNKGRDSFRDMQLMACCGTNILANSSFSWWAGYLNETNNPKIIAPARWTNDYVEYQHQLPNWILI